jgi:hypothetical protein
MLFLRPIDFTQYEADGNIRIYWLWTEDFGFVHRDHIMEKLAQSQVREQKIVMPEPNRVTTPEAVAARGGKTIIKKGRQ